MLKINNCRFVGNGVGISMPGDAPVSIDGTEFIDNGQAVEIRDPHTAYAQLGLPADTPEEAIYEAIDALKAAKPTTPDDFEAVVRKTSFWQWMGRAANAATVISFLATAANLN